MRDPIGPARAAEPAECLDLVATAISDGDLDAALAQYEQAAVLHPWQDPRGRPLTVAGGLAALMELRLPLLVQVENVVLADGVALVLGCWQLSGTGPDCERVDLRGCGGTTVRWQPGGGWLIAADAWQLDDVSPEPVRLRLA